MEPGHSTVEPEHHGVAPDLHDVSHEVSHDAVNHEFYAVSNPKYFGLPLGVLIAASVSAIAVGITLLKFFGAML